MKKITMKLSIPKLKRPSPGQIVLWALAVVLAVGSAIFLKDFVACWTITALPGVPPQNCGTAGQVLTGPDIISEDGTVVIPDVPLPDVAAPESNLPPAWDGASRVTLLFIGLDERDWEIGQGAPRSDTMILFTIDPISKTAGMLSVPRDMWVNIPGFGYSRINTAYSLGEGNKLPGGGPGLATQTIEQFIGVPIQYYAQVDFKAFEEAIDAMGGLYFCLDEKLTIDPIGPKPPVKVGPGCRTYWGYEILGIARNRKTEGGDVDRANRQQQVVLALVDQVFSPQNFPTMVSKAPKIYDEAAAGLRTNLTFDDALKLGVLLSQVPRENIKRGVIDYSMVTFDNVVLGGQNASIFKPIPDKIRVLRDEIFSTGGPLSPIATGDPVALMQADAARVRVLNGTFTGGLAETTANYLLSQGVQVIDAGNADRQYDRTVIVLYGPKLYTLRYLYGIFGLSAANQIVFSPDPASPVDVEVRLGGDWLSIMP
jgi:LCP family protein required for cell wall assembly